VLEVAAVLIFDLGAFTHPAGGAVSLAGLDPGRLFTAGVGGVFAFTIAAFTGFEGSPDYAEETRDAARTVRRSTFVTVAVTGGLYAVSAWALSVRVGPAAIVATAQDPTSGIPFSLIAADFGPAGPALATIANLLLLTSLLAGLLSFHNVVARYGFAAGRDGILPGWLARIGRRSAAPVAGSLAQSVLGLAVIVVFAVGGLDPVTALFTWLSYLSAVGVLVLMIGTCVAVVGFFRVNPALSSGRASSVVAPAVSGVALLVVLWFTLTNSGSMLGVTNGAPLTWLLNGILAAAIGVGVWRGRRLRTTHPVPHNGTVPAVSVPGLVIPGQTGPESYPLAVLDPHWKDIEV